MILANLTSQIVHPICFVYDEDADEDDEPAYHNILVPRRHHRSKSEIRKAKELALLEPVCAQLDNILYEAYSHFQVSHKPYHFVIQANPASQPQGKLLAALEEMPGCTREDRPTTASGPSSEDPVLEALAEHPAVITNSLVQMFSKPGVCESKPAFATSPSSRVVSPTLSPSAAKAVQRKEFGDSDDDNYSDDFGEPDQNTSTNQAPETNSSGSEGGTQSGSGTEDEPPPEAWGPPQPIHFELMWSPTLSLVNLQKHFQAARIHSEKFLLPTDTKQESIDVGSPQEEASPVYSQHNPASPASPDDNPSFTLDSLRGCAKAIESHALERVRTAPAVLLAIFPWLTDAHYSFLASEATFLSQDIPVCESCFLEFTDVGARHQYSSRLRRETQGKVDHFNIHSKSALSAQLASNAHIMALMNGDTLATGGRRKAATKKLRRYSDVQTFNAMLC
eukprot:NODE_455_length_1728_cov_88.434187_g380_i0.p1 GENE.NODE_455_length_1728_cov_88.434187_g380_i0~~NODE_455_length_1728_cov_88.434187_g380_i0.p1  ORF type:complete len:450 (-),score=105.61 NODE_455_length_1728_cov_88.434187_g380_i0:94-1443(-)